MTYEQAKNHTGITLVEFYASWCPHCQRMEPVVEEIKELTGGKIPVCQYDIDEHPREAENAGADTIPTFIIYRDGREVWRHVGEVASDELLAALQMS